MRNLLIRADSRPEAGSGHKMRCLALAQAWEDCGGRVHFVPDHDCPGSPEDARQLAAGARQIGAEWVVVDGYAFGADYQRTLKADGCRVLFLDDCGHGSPYAADLILNQNLHAGESLYGDREPYVRLLLGPQYALLRGEFRGRRPDAGKSPDGRRLLVTLGGSDPGNTTSRVLESMRRLDTPGVECIVVAGPANPWRGQLASAVRDLPFPARVEADADMPALMTWADLAISAGGSTCWELAFMGVPFLVLAIAGNQRPIAESLCARGVALPWSWEDGPEQIALLLSDLRLRADMAQRGRALIDGQGAMRVARLLMHAEMSEQTGLEELHLRPVCAEHCGLIWTWANDPEVRAASFCGEPIPWDAHVCWFHGRLVDESCHFYIARDDHGTPVGQVRYETRQNEAVISLSLDPQARGKGYGVGIIRLSARMLFRDTAVCLVKAYVKPDNHASLWAFAKAGFARSGEEEVHGQQALLFQLRKEDMA